MDDQTWCEKQGNQYISGTFYQVTDPGADKGINKFNALIYTLYFGLPS